MIVTTGQGWTQLGELGLALVLSALIGLEREWQQKSAGLRTHTLVGVGAALFMLVSKYGFADIVDDFHVALDPSRVAAQIVSGIGFIGGGLIFVRRDIVRGLTTAAVVWETAAVGMACGGGLWLLAVAVTGAHFVITQGFPVAVSRIRRAGTAISELRLTYQEGVGTLRRALVVCTDRGFTIAEVSVGRYSEDGESGNAVSVSLELHGGGSLSELTAAVSELPGVLSVAGDDLAES